ncbi:DUF6932 family protein [Pseudomonas sp. 5P_3.1_Bac2]|uniref:DUF6932 family protein n=1 Tax=Pseudomonas sp. 5P_3.1_Bac2 TaxID=2971617 RepID=UPI0021C7F84C|nr:hypothetical protein [Pseudomonas sp. 5P_3.1_Bac2]MCU1717342.1 hypothetical protein [Pseudomonas sp. 5P_3.1_Bac2]
MAKPDFPALLTPGIHQMSLQQLLALAVTPFPNDARRTDLSLKLTTWVNALQAAGVTGQLWIDGSFLTEKPNPGDIDCVLWSPAWVSPALVTPNILNQVQQLLDHAHAEAVYNLDFYLETPAPDQIFHREAYWRGILGYCHDRVTAKGFAEITL